MRLKMTEEPANAKRWRGYVYDLIGENTEMEVLSYLSSWHSSEIGGVDLRGVNFAALAVPISLLDCDLRGADLSAVRIELLLGMEGNLTDDTTKWPPEIPFVPDIDARILDVVRRRQGNLYMGTWHQCGTTHCRAGWAVTLAGKAGWALEAKVSADRAGKLIYARSRPNQPAPDFYLDTFRALEDMGDPDPEGTIALMCERPITPELREQTIAEHEAVWREVIADLGRPTMYSTRASAYNPQTARREPFKPTPWLMGVDVSEPDDETEEVDETTRTQDNDGEDE